MNELSYESPIFTLPFEKTACASCNVATILAAILGLVSNWFTRLIRLANVTWTVKLAEPPPTFPALSVAEALKALAPRLNEYAGPLIFAQVLLATPDKASLGVHGMATVLSTAYVPRLPA